MAWEPEMLEGYYYNPPFRDKICKECCLGFVQGPYSAIPCPKCKHITGFTMVDKNKILSESMPYDQFTLKVRHYSMGIDIENKRMVDMDSVFHEHYLKKEKEAKDIHAKPLTNTELQKLIKEKKNKEKAKSAQSIAKTAVKNEWTLMPKKEKTNPAPKEKTKPKVDENIDLREVALGALFKDQNGELDEGP